MWIKLSKEKPTEEAYYKVKYDDETTDRKPYRIRPSKSIDGFMTERNVVEWKKEGKLLIKNNQ